MAVTRWDGERYAGAGYGRRYAWIDFVNSQYRDGFGNSIDYLSDRGWRLAFLRTSGLRVRQAASFPFGAFNELRANLRLAAEEITNGIDVSAITITRLNDALSGAVFRTIEFSGRFYTLTFRPKCEDWRWISAQIVASFATFLESGKTSRLKICPNDDCRWLFFDETKGNTKRWCNDRLCGNRDKVRRYRAARRGGKGHASVTDSS